MCRLYQHWTQNRTVLLKWLVTMAEEQLKDFWSWCHQDLEREWERGQVHFALKQRGLTFQERLVALQKRYLTLKKRHLTLLERLVEAQKQQRTVVHQAIEVTASLTPCWSWQSPLCCLEPIPEPWPCLAPGCHLQTSI